MMTITLDAIEFLDSDTGRQLLNHLAQQDLSDQQTLPLLTHLRRHYPVEHAAAGLEMARLRRKAAEKFGADARRMFFTREALEQASDPLVRAYRSRVAQGRRVLDLCCGIGSDALAMAQAGADVLGLDNDLVRVRIARYNAAVLGIKARFEVADVHGSLPNADMAFYDPARRDRQGRRIYDVERYEPPLSLIRNWQFPLIVVKLSPGVNPDQLASYGGGVEFVSVSGDLKEAVLWLGSDLKSTKATLLTSQGEFHWLPSSTPLPPRVSEPHGWLVEPDPALLRAGLVAEVAATFNGWQLDETIAYFTTDDQPVSPWVRAWHILDWMPFNLKRLRAYLREHKVGQVTVKKRGVAMTPDELTARLKLKGDESRTLILTRCAGKPMMLVCLDYASNLLDRRG
jgi:SAM-dependent methyltransferase